MLNNLQELIRGKTVLVLGSAPGPVIPDNLPDDYFLICVNGSVVVAEELSLKVPDITFFAVATLVKNRHSSNEKKEILKNNFSKISLIRTISKSKITRIIKMLQAWYTLKKIRFKYESVFEFDAGLSDKVIAGVYGEDLHLARNISTGVFAAVFSYFCGAEKIYISGINPDSTGHGYSRLNLPRAHIENDRRALRWLVDRGCIYV